MNSDQGKSVPSFQSELERQRWFIANADYFTAITRRKMRYERSEFPTLAEAETFIKQAMAEDPDIRSFLIYAVVGQSDSFVKTVIRHTNGDQSPADAVDDRV